MAFRSFLCASVVVTALAAGCDDGKIPNPPVTPVPDKATSAATTAPTSTSSATAALPAPTETAASTTDVPPPAKTAEAPATTGTAVAKSEAIPMPKANSGILPKGAADKLLKSGSKPVVKLVDAGSEPRTSLAYQVEKGTKATLVMGIDMTMAMKSGAQALPETSIPLLKMQLDMSTLDKSAEGDAQINAVLGGVKVEPKKDPQQEQMAAAMKDQTAKLKGLSMAYWVTPKGNVHDLKVTVPEGFPAGGEQMLQGMNQSFESMVAPLPAEPVGEGAKWQVITRVSSAGADILQFATYTLKSKKDTVLEVGVTLAQLAASDAIKAPNMPDGVKATLKSFSSGGTGSNVINLKSVAPDSGTMALKTSMELGVTTGTGAPEDSSVSTKLTVTFSKPK